MAEPVKSVESVRFGRFELSVETGELRKDGIRMKLSGQAIQVLAILAANPGKLVTREKLQQKLWPGASYGDPEHGLNAAVNKLREALGDSASEPKYIETVPGRGYRFIGVLESLVPEPEPSEPDPQPPKPPWGKRKATIAIAACVVTVGLLLLSPQIERMWRMNELRRLTVVPLTTLPGRVWSPTFSPDGNQIAFVWSGNDFAESTDLYAKVIGNENLLRLTHGHAGVYTVRPAWSPNGKSIAFCRWAEPKDSGIFLISPLGGPERKISSSICAEKFGPILSWSPDGKKLAFLHHPADSASDNAIGLFVLSLDSLAEVPVRTGCTVVQTPAFSPRGDYLAWACAENMISVPIYLQRLTDGKITELVRSLEGIGGLAWSDDERRIVFSTGFDGGDLWELALARPNRPEKLPFGHDAEDLAVSFTGHRLAYKQSRVNVNIWRVDLSNLQAPAQKIVSSSRAQEAPDYSPDGTKIAFESNRSGNYEVWVSDADGSNALQVSSFGVRQTGTPRWAPDGQLIAFDSRVGGQANIYLVDPHGGIPRKLDVDLRGNNVPSWSHDGKWIYFVNGEDTGHSSVWKVSSAGGHAVKVAMYPAEFPIESPDGQHVYFSRDSNLWQVKIDGTGEKQIQGIPPVGIAGWTPFGSGIYFLGDANGKTEIKFFDLGTRAVRKICVMDKYTAGWMGGLPVSPDGRWLLFAQMDDLSSDIMLVENYH